MCSFASFRFIQKAAPSANFWQSLQQQQCATRLSVSQSGFTATEVMNSLGSIVSHAENIGGFVRVSSKRHAAIETFINSFQAHSLAATEDVKTSKNPPF
jgi:hypothetical protein